MDSLKFRCLKEFVELAKEKGSKVYFVTSPIYRNFINEKDYSFLSDNLHIDGLWSFEQDSYFLNRNQYFKDPTHLNHSGAEVFTQKIVSLIKTNI